MQVRERWSCKQHHTVNVSLDINRSENVALLTAPLQTVEPIDRLATSIPMARASWSDSSEAVGMAETAAKRVTMTARNCILKVGLVGEEWKLNVMEGGKYVKKRI